MLYSFLKDLLYFNLYVLFILVLSPLSLMCCLYKFAVKAIVNLFLTDSIGKDFSTLDNYFMSTDPNYLEKPDAVLSFLVTLNGCVDMIKFKKEIGDRLSNLRNTRGQYMYGRIRQFPRKLYGYYFYQWDRNFDINNHITEFDKPLNKVSLDHFIAYQSRVKYESNHPLWNVVVVHRYNEEDKTLIYFRMHHTIGDGISILRFMMSRVFSGESLKSDLDTLCKFQSPGCVNWKKLTSKELYCKTLGWPRQFINNLSSNSELFDPITAQMSSVIVCSTKRIPLRCFKDLKRNCNIPMTVALFASISYALQNYIKNNSTNNRNKSDSFSMTTALPVSRVHPDDLVNDFGVGSIKIPISSETTGPTVWDMSNYIMEQFDKLKASLSPLCLVIPTLISVFPFEIWKLLSPHNKGVLVSNMMGPSLSTTIFDTCNTVEDIKFWIQTAAFPSLSFNILSYNGNVEIGIMGCTNIVQNKDSLEELGRNIENSLQVLFEEDKCKFGSFII